MTRPDDKKIDWFSLAVAFMFDFDVLALQNLGTRLAIPSINYRVEQYDSTNGWYKPMNIVNEKLTLVILKEVGSNIIR